MLCGAKYVSKLKFNCSGDLVLKEIYHGQNEHNITKLFVDISHGKIKPGDLNEHSCVCEATSYSGSVLRSRAAAAKIACKYFKQCFLFDSSVCELEQFSFECRKKCCNCFGFTFIGTSTRSRCVIHYVCKILSKTNYNPSQYSNLAFFVFRSAEYKTRLCCQPTFQIIITLFPDPDLRLR